MSEFCSPFTYKDVQELSDEVFEKKLWMSEEKKWKLWKSWFDDRGSFLVKPVIILENEKGEAERLPSLEDFGPWGGLMNEVTLKDALSMEKISHLMEAVYRNVVRWDEGYSVNRVHLIHKGPGYVTPWHRDIGHPHMVIYVQLVGVAVFDSLGPYQGYEMRQRFKLLEDSDTLRMEASKAWFMEKDNFREGFVAYPGDLIVITPTSTHQVWTVEPTFALGFECEIDKLKDHIRTQDVIDAEENAAKWSKVRLQALQKLVNRLPLKLSSTEEVKDLLLKAGLKGFEEEVRAKRKAEGSAFVDVELREKVHILDQKVDQLNDKIEAMAKEFTADMKLLQQLINTKNEGNKKKKEKKLVVFFC